MWAPAFTTRNGFGEYICTLLSVNLTPGRSCDKPWGMKFERLTSLPSAEVLERLKALTDYWNKKYGIAGTWSGNTLRLKGKMMGVSFDGTVAVGEGRLDANVDAGFLAEKLGGKKYVEGKLDAYLDPARTLEALRARIPA